MNQLSIFDIELPPAAEKVSFARVPDSEYKNWRPFDVPQISGILKLLENGAYKVSRYEFISDVFECLAIAISNRFDLRNYERREKKYLQIIKKYNKDMQLIMTKVCAEIFKLLSSMISPHVGFADYLGELYMRSDTSNSKSGQFFTPYCISKACAKCTVNAVLVEKSIEDDTILTLHEPTCGSGGMVLACADVLYNDYHFNISRNLLVECGDIDARCVHMSYLQLGLAGIPAVIFHRDALSLETWDRWETPAYIMQYSRFRGVFAGTPSDWK